MTHFYNWRKIARTKSFYLLILVCSLCFPVISIAEPELDSTTNPLVSEPDAVVYEDDAAETSTVAADDSDAWAITASPLRNTTNVVISNDKFSYLCNIGKADTVRVTARVIYKGSVTREISFERQLADINADSFEVDFGNYGKFNVNIEYLLEGQVVYTGDSISVGVTADTYNISPVSATLPVTFFSLNLWGEQSIRSTGPVIAMLERANSYDWDNLPKASADLYGMYSIPYLTESDVRYQPGDFGAASTLFRSRATVMADYVHDLMELDSTSKINLYCVDYYAGLVQRVIYANKIPSDQYKIYLMSDGSFSSVKFGDVYSSADNYSVNSRMIDEWNTAKQDAYRNGKIDTAFENWEFANCYLWALVDAEPNAQWWVARKDLIKSSGDDNAFGKTVQANDKLVQVNISNLLKTNIQPSEQNTAEFKALYNFNDGYFKAAEENGKDVMMFLGTRVTSEQAFSEYARFAQLYYGDAYEYYYKGHPGTPSSLYPNKVKQLDDLGITDVDSSVAAELILFFNPDIYLSGYQSSTYASVPSGMAKGMFEMTKAQGLAQPQYNDMDYWSSRITDSTDAAVKALAVSGHSNFLVEFSDDVSSAKGYDIAIWDATDSIAKFYKKEGTSYRLVDQSKSDYQKPAVEAGEYVIKSALSQRSVLDVAGGSQNDCANVQLYSYNGSAAQKWSVTFDDNGYATIKNVGSGKVLDAQYGNSNSGTNVWQYAGSDSNKAQKWRITANDDGTVSIISALSSTSAIDVSNGSSANGSNVQLWSSNGSQAQRFTFVATSPKVSSGGQADIADGYYTFTTATNLKHKLDVQAWSKSDGARIQLWDSTDGENQTFKIQKQDDGFYSITSVWSGKSLDVDSGCVIPGTKIQQWAFSGDNGNQKWAIYANEGGSYTLRNVASGLYLTLHGNRAGNGAAVVGSLANGLENQRWLIAQTKEPYKSMDDWARDNAAVLEDGVYVIQSGLRDELVLDVAGGSKNNSANVQLYDVNLSNAQKWQVSHDENGYVTFTNVGSGKVLDVSGGTSAAGANVQQYESNGSKAQKWIVVEGKDGRKTIVPALSASLGLDIAGANSNRGANVQLYTRNVTDAQSFSFYKLV